LIARVGRADTEARRRRPRRPATCPTRDRARWRGARREQATVVPPAHGRIRTQTAIGGMATCLADSARRARSRHNSTRGSTADHQPVQRMPLRRRMSSSSLPPSSPRVPPSATSRGVRGFVTRSMRASRSSASGKGFTRVSPRSCEVPLKNPLLSLYSVSGTGCRYRLQHRLRVPGCAGFQVLMGLPR